MINRTFANILYILSSTFLLIHTSYAHEMWLEPVKYSVKPDETIYAHEKVGQNFKGNQYSYLKSSYKKLEISLNDKTQAIKSRIGDLPAIHEHVKSEGLAILSAVSSVSDIQYKTWESFESFIKSKGLDWVLAKHKERKLPLKDFTEAYQRFPKALVSVGNGEGNDKILGLKFEWLIKTNPYTTPYDSNGYIKAQLYWEGKPLPNAHVSVFNKYANKLIKTDLHTDEEGFVKIPQANGGQFLLNAVQMKKPTAKVRNETGAAWQSFWASVTYEVKSNSKTSKPLVLLVRLSRLGRPI